MGEPPKMKPTRASVLCPRNPKVCDHAFYDDGIKLEWYKKQHPDGVLNHPPEGFSQAFRTSPWVSGDACSCLGWWSQTDAHTGIEHTYQGCGAPDHAEDWSNLEHTMCYVKNGAGCPWASDEYGGNRRWKLGGAEYDRWKYCEQSENGNTGNGNVANNPTMEVLQNSVLTFAMDGLPGKTDAPAGARGLAGPKLLGPDEPPWALTGRERMSRIKKAQTALVPTPTRSSATRASIATVYSLACAYLLVLELCLKASNILP